MRKLATVRKISEIRPIPGADAIELAGVGGWQTVVKRGEYKAGDLAVYIEVDSWVPTTLAPFLSKGKEPKVFEGVQGERLRTVKLRGALSQGLLLPGTICPTGLMVGNPDCMQHIFQEGDDVSDWMGIKKWERPIPAQLAGQVKGSFPSLIPKTDQERVQNLVDTIRAAQGSVFEVTEKLEGSSMTAYLIDGKFGVCSRNLDLKRDPGNSFWATAIRNDIEAKMREVGDNFAIQGELVGPGVQGNIYGFNELEFYVFDVYSIKEGVYLNPAERRGLIKTMGLKHVPVVDTDWILDAEVDILLSMADAPSVYGNTLREGLVFKEVGGGMTFKAVSNAYLLKHGD